MIIFHWATIDTENRKRLKSIGKAENKSLGRNRTMTHQFLLNQDKDMLGSDEHGYTRTPGPGYGLS
jgi:hypothetical protein